MPRPHPLSSRRAFSLGAAFLIATLSCGREVTGPDGVRFANQIAFRTLFAGGDLANAVASELVPYTKVRVVLERGAGRPAFDEVVEFPAGSEELRINARIQLSDEAPPSGELMDLTLSYINAANDTVFRGGPTPVTVAEVRDGEVPVTPADVPIDYTGPGSEANQVSISPVTLTVVSGDPFTFTASATVDGEVPVANAPIAWRSLDPTLALITAPGAGAGTTLAGRGTARIVAQLLDGQADTVLLTVTPRAQSLAIVSGNNQTGVSGGTLAAPVVVRTTATDGEPIEGIAVTFTPANGGSVGTANVVTDANGLAQTTWTLGPSFGAHTMTASSVGLTGSPVTFTAQTPALQLLHHYPIEESLEDLAGTADGNAFGQASISRVLQLDGASAYAVFPSMLVPTSGSYSVSFFLKQGAAPTTAATYVSQGATGGPGFFIGHSSTGELRVGEGWTATGVSAPANDGLFHHIVLVVDATAGESRLWVDGVLSATLPQALATGATGTATRLGRMWDSLGDFFNGELDELRVYGGALSAGQVAGLWDAGPSAPDRLVFGVQPSAAAEGAVISPPVTVRREDAAGRLATGFSGEVAIAIGTNPEGGVLSGTTSVDAVGGIATFGTLSIDVQSGGYTLLATTAGLTAVESTPFTITAGGGSGNAVSWTNPAGGAWSVPSNWSTGSVPTATDSVVIALDGTYTVTLDASPTVGALTIGGGTGTRTLVAVARDLTVARALTILANAGLSTEGTSIHGTGAVVNEGTLTFSGGTITNPVENRALFVARGASTLFGLFTTTATSTLQVLGATGFGTGNLTVSNTFTNQGSIELSSVGTGFASQLTVTNGWLENGIGATITTSVGAGGARTLAARLVNRGTLTVNAALALSRASSSHANELGGVIALAAANLTVTQSGTSPSFVNLGTITLGADRTLSVVGGTLNLVTGTLIGHQATLSTNGVTLLFSTASTQTRLNLAATTILDPVVIPANDSLVLIGGALNAPLQNDGQLLVQGSVTLGGAVTTGAGSLIRVRGLTGFGNGQLTVTEGFTNTAAIELTSVVTGFASSLTVSNGTLTNAPEGTITALTGVGGARTLTAQLANQGTITLETGLTLAGPSAAHVNSGTIAVTGGNLTVTQTGTAPSFANAGAIALAAGRVLSVSGGTLDLTGGTIAGTGATLSTSNATLVFTTPEARTELTLTNTTVPGTFTIPAGDSLVLKGGSPTFTLVNDGLLITQDAVTLNGSLTTGPGSVLRIRGITSNGNGALTLPTGFTNSAAVELTSVVTGFAASLTVTGGPLVNTSTGTITALAGAGGARTLAATIDNQGLISLADVGLTIAQASAAHTNAGTIDITGGNLTLTQSGTEPGFVNTGAINIAPTRTFSVTNGALDLTGGTLVGGTGTLVTNNVTLAFTTATARTRLTLNNTTVPGTFTIPAGDSIVLAGGTPTFTLVNDGLLIAQDAVTLNGSLTTGPGSTLRVRGLTSYGNGALTLPAGFTNSAAVELTSVVTGFAASLTVTGGPLVNTSTGTITALAGAGGARTLAAAIDNQGLIDLADVGLTIAQASAAHTNTGTIDITGGNLVLTQSGTTPSFVNTGTINIAATRILDVTGGILDLVDGTLAGGTGTLETNNVTLGFTTTSARTRLTLNNTTVPGTFTIPAGDSIVLAGGTPTFTLVNDGLLITQGAVTLNGTLTTGPGSTLRVRGLTSYGNATLTLPNGFTNSATVDLTSVGTGFASTLAAPAGTIVNTASGVINSEIGIGGARTIAAQLDNQGIINLPTALTIARAGATHVNSGTFNVTVGNLTITQTGTTPSFSNLPGGAIHLGTGRFLTVTGGALDLTQGLLDGTTGTLSTNNVELSFTVPTVRTLFNLVNTVVPHTVTIPAADAITLVGGALNAPIVNNGDLRVQGTVTLGGSITTNLNSLISVRGITSYGNGVLTVTNGFTNTERIEVTSVGTGFASTLAVTNGTLTNAPGASIEFLPGAGGARTLAAELLNQGTVTVATGTAFARAGSAHVNASVIDVTGGNLTVTQTGTTPSFTNTGTINLSAARFLAFTGGTVDLSTGLVDGATGQVSTNASTLSFTPATVVPPMTLVNTTVPHTVTIGPAQLVRLFGGSLNAPIVNQGTLQLYETVTLGGAITNSAGGSIRILGATSRGNAVATITNGFTNSGTIELGSEGTGFASTMNVTTGALTNAAGGALNVLAGVGGARTFTGALIDNLGTLTVTAPWAANTALDQRNTMNVTSGTTTVSGASTFHGGSVTTLSGTGALVKAGTCSNLGGTGNGSVCP